MPPGGLPATPERGQAGTRESAERRIARRLEASVQYHARYPDEIDQRLRELDAEWDIERVLETNAASFALSGVLLGAFIDRRFLLLPAAVTAFLLQHALQGWCPPLPVFRRIGVRTAQEIARERSALKSLRGDFSAVSGVGTPQDRARQALSAVSG